MKGEVGVFRSGTLERSEPMAWIGEEEDLMQRPQDPKGRGRRVLNHREREEHRGEEKWD